MKTDKKANYFDMKDQNTKIHSYSRTQSSKQLHFSGFRKCDFVGCKLNKLF